MLYSIGKDSSVMLHLAMKAFYPSSPPFPLLHVDTTWKFREMIEFRDRRAAELGLDLIVHINHEGVEQGVGPFTHGSQVHTDIMKTQGLKQALDKYKFDAAFGGARRDEEKSRAKERVFSFRNAQHRWDPEEPAPELWHLYNGAFARARACGFPAVQLDGAGYLAVHLPGEHSHRAAVLSRNGARGGARRHADHGRRRPLPLEPGESPKRSWCVSTLGCYPLTGAIESDAETLPPSSKRCWWRDLGAGRAGNRSR